jgi:hypothetical protein
MAKRQNGVNKSEEIRQLLKANPKTSGKEAVAALAAKGVEISDALFYFVKGQIKGRKGRKKKAKQVVAQAAETTNAPKSYALSTILKIKTLATEVGSLKELKALVEVMSE